MLFVSLVLFSLFGDTVVNGSMFGGVLVSEPIADVILSVFLVAKYPLVGLIDCPFARACEDICGVVGAFIVGLVLIIVVVATFFNVGGRVGILKGNVWCACVV